jgi:hypothetical protein
MGARLVVFNFEQTCPAVSGHTDLRTGGHPLETGCNMRDPCFYRALAEDCVRLARRASTPQYRYGLLNIAHTWLRLAHGAEIANLDWHEPKEEASKRARPTFSGDSAASVPRPH